MFTFICGIDILLSGFLSSIFSNKSLRSSETSALLETESFNKEPVGSQGL